MLASGPPALIWALISAKRLEKVGLLRLLSFLVWSAKLEATRQRRKIAFISFGLMLCFFNFYIMRETKPRLLKYKIYVLSLFEYNGAEFADSFYLNKISISENLQFSNLGFLRNGKLQIRNLIIFNFLISDFKNANLEFF